MTSSASLADIEDKLLRLGSPATGLVRNIRLAQNVICNYSFANAWVARPGPTPGSIAADLPPLSASGHAGDPQTALQLLIMEAIERHSSLFSGSETFCLARSSELPRHELLSLFHHSRKQRHMRSDRIPVEDPWWVGEPLGENALINWVEARSLRTGNSSFVPAGFVYLGYGVDKEPLYAIADSTGCAAAPTVAEATARALLEVLERDALGIWWYNRLSRPAFDFSRDSLLHQINAELQKIGRTLCLLDISHDLGAAAVAAYSADWEGRRIYLGCAADFSPRQAAHRATSEMLQFLFWGTVSTNPAAWTRWLENATLTTEPWLKPHSFHRLPELVICESPECQIGRLLGQLDRKELNPLVINLTKSWIDVPVVRVLVPQLRSHRPHFGRGRLYEVPQQLGWLSEKRREAELNRYSCPI